MYYPSKEYIELYDLANSSPIVTIIIFIAAISLMIAMYSLLKPALDSTLSKSKKMKFLFSFFVFGFLTLFMMSLF